MKSPRVESVVQGSGYLSSIRTHNREQKTQNVPGFCLETARVTGKFASRRVVNIEIGFEIGIVQ